MVALLMLLMAPPEAPPLPAGDARLAALLEKASAQGRRFAQEFPSYTCTEHVLQMKFSQGNHVDARHEESYDYLILIQDDGARLTFEESRLRRGQSGKLPQTPLLATTGFAVLSVIFHEEFQPSYRFEWVGPEPIGQRMLEKVRFEPISGRPTPSVLEVGGRQYALEWKGTAWLDPASGAPVRIEADLAGTLDDIGLTALHSEVEYAPADPAGAVWLPRQAIVEARTRRQRWRNVHSFSAYRKFDVQTEQKIQEVKQ